MAFFISLRLLLGCISVCSRESSGVGCISVCSRGISGVGCISVCSRGRRY
jgi:hypothetical protein